MRHSSLFVTAVLACSVSAFVPSCLQGEPVAVFQKDALQHIVKKDHRNTVGYPKSTQTDTACQSDTSCDARPSITMSTPQEGVW
eukprot:38900-Eustigmatos_ZCMA.PRE.1